MSTTAPLPKLPIKEFRAARGIKASIWRHDDQRDGRTFTRYSVHIQKSYRDDAGNWQTTEYYNRDDVPHVVLLANKAFEFISLKESQQAPNDENLPL